MAQSALLQTVRKNKEFLGLAFGKVIKIYPEANMIDIMLMDDSIISKVQVLTSFASSRTGSLNMPIPEYVEGELVKKQFPLISCEPTESDVWVVVAYLGDSLHIPVALGYLLPEENEVLCSRRQEGNSDGSMFLWKHSSNVYTRIADDGDTEISHPSGVLIKIGKDMKRTEINNYDFRVRPFKFKSKKTDEPSSAPYLTILHPSGNYYIIDPKGNVMENIVGDVSRTIKGNLTETIEGDRNIKVKGNVDESSEGDWTRTASGELKDAGSEIHHNEWER
jgi:hypothetical protein